MRGMLRLRNKLSFWFLLLNTWSHVDFITLFFHERSGLLFWLWNWPIHVNFICFIFPFFNRSSINISGYPGFTNIIILKSTFCHWDRFNLGIGLRMNNTLMILNHGIRTNWFLIIALSNETLLFRFFIWEFPANFTVHHKIPVEFSIDENRCLFEAHSFNVIIVKEIRNDSCNLLRIVFFYQLDSFCNNLIQNIARLNVIALVSR